MAIRTKAALVGALSLLTSTTAFAASAAKTAPKPPAAAKAAVVKPAVTQPAAARPVVVVRPAGLFSARPSVQKSQEPPPGVRIQPSPGQAAAIPATAAPATATATPQAPAAKAAPIKKAAAKPAKKKKQIAKSKTKVKTGRAAAGASALANVDKNQLAIDHLSGAETKSPLDVLASYKETVHEGDLETAGVLLRLAAQDTPDHALITQVNDLLGISVNTEDTEILLQIARGSRANAFAKDAPATKSAALAASPVSTRVQLAHAAVESVPRSSRIEALGVYKRAVAEERSDLAALALGAVVGTLDEETVTKANTLLGLSSVIPAGQIVAQASAQ